jgi:hypothetical protein
VPKASPRGVLARATFNGVRRCEKLGLDRIDALFETRACRSVGGHE